jgi:hypothetical protein
MLRHPLSSFVLFASRRCRTGLTGGTGKGPGSLRGPLT